MGDPRARTSSTRRGLLACRAARGLLVGIAAAILSAASPHSPSPASARDLTAVERSSLARTVERFDAAMRKKDIPAVIDIVPPRVVAQIAAEAGVDPKTLRGVMIKQTREVMNSDVLRAFRMDLPGTTYRETPNGTPYALVPTYTTVRIGGRDSEQSSISLAMMDGGRWYLLDLNQPSRVAIFTRVYPEFAGVPLGGQGI